MKEYFGCLLPERFSTISGEYNASRATCVLFDFSFLGALEFTGKDRVAFLHGLLTNDIKGLNAGKGCHACLVTKQGKIISVMRILATDGSCLADMVRPHIAATADTLKKYIIMDDVIVKDAGGAGDWLALVGPRSRDVLQALGVPVQALSVCGHQEVQFKEIPIRIVRETRLEIEEYDLFMPHDRKDQVRQEILSAGGAVGLIPAGMETLDVLRVEAGVPWYPSDYSESDLPIEANLGGAISYTKGCYMGQEIMARIKTYGHPPKVLVGLKIKGLGAGSRDAIFKEGKEIGRVTSAVVSPRLGPIALASVNWDFRTAGTKVNVGEIGEAEVVELPFQ